MTANLLGVGARVPKGGLTVEIIAYYPIDAGIALCPDCACGYADTHGGDLDDPEDYAVSFDGAETEGAPPTCDACNEPIEGFAVLCGTGRGGYEVSSCQCDAHHAARGALGLGLDQAWPDRRDVERALRAWEGKPYHPTRDGKGWTRRKAPIPGFVVEEWLAILDDCDPSTIATIRTYAETGH